MSPILTDGPADNLLRGPTMTADRNPVDAALNSSVSAFGTYATAVGSVADRKPVDAALAAAKTAFSTYAKAATPVPTATRFGTSVNATSDPGRWKAATGTAPAVIRHFYTALPATWGADPILAGLPTSAVAVLSFKTGSAAAVTAFLKSKPAGQVVHMAYYHEPEDNFTTAAAWASYRAQWATFGPAIRAGGGIPTLILMAYTLMPGSGRDWHNYYEAGAVDFMAWDAYNPGQKHTPGTYTDYAFKMVPLFKAVAAATGKPWGLGEHGSPVVTGSTDAARVTWVKATHAALVAAGARWACWWDASNPATGFDNTASTAVMQAWTGAA